MANKGLGKGLAAILGNESVAAAEEKRKLRRNHSGEGTADGKRAGKGQDVSRETSTLPLSMIEPNAGQPRKVFEEESLNELADSIREHGVISPIIVKKNGRMYTIVVGERRWRAARLAGLKEIPAIIREYDERQTAEIALIENIQREDLSSVEEARAYRALIEEFGLTQEDVAKRVSKNRTTITNSLRLLQLDDEILDMIENGELSAGHARALLAVNGKRAQYKAAREVVNDGLSVRDTEKLAKKYNSKTEKKTGGKKETDIYMDALKEELTEAVQLKVNIRQKGKSRGAVEILYNTADELEMIIDRLKGMQ